MVVNYYSDQVSILGKAYLLGFEKVLRYLTLLDPPECCVHVRSSQTPLSLWSLLFIYIFSFSFWLASGFKPFFSAKLFPPPLLISCYYWLLPFLGHYYLTLFTKCLNYSLLNVAVV